MEREKKTAKVPPGRGNRMRFGVAASALAVGTVVLAACGSSASTSASATAAAGTSTASAAASNANGTFGITSTHPDLTGMTIHIANQGTPDISRLNSFHVVQLLKSWGANATLFWASSPGIASSVMLSGQDQVLISTIPNLLPGVINGLHLQAFGLNSPRVDYALVSTKSYSSVQQLKGKSVGVYAGSPSDITYVLLNDALTANGMTPSDVRIIKAGGQSARADQLAAGSLAATVVGHAALIRLASDGVKDLYDFSVKDSTLYNSVLWAKPSWLSANPKLATAVDLAELETDAWLSSPSNQSAQIAEDQANIAGGKTADITSLLNLYQKYNLFGGQPVLTNAQLQSQESMYFKLGTIPSDPPLSQWSTTAYDTAALKVVNSTG